MKLRGLSMPSRLLFRVLRSHPTESSLVVLLLAISVALSLNTGQYLTFANLFNLLNTSSTNLIFAVGLLVVLIAGGIDISFAVAASVVQYVIAVALLKVGGGNWIVGIGFAAVAGI